MKSLMLLWKVTAEELGRMCCTDTSRDYQTVTARSECEGLSFLTITLPDFGKAFERALDEGKVRSDSFPGFRMRAGLPQFLGGFLSRIFDRSSGVLLDVPDVDSIFSIRQLTLMFGKILIPCSDARLKGAIDAYKQCDIEVREWNNTTCLADLQSLEQVFTLLYGNILAGVNDDLVSNRLLPKHGPGATADRLRGNAKYDQYEKSSWPIRLDRHFPYGEWCVPSWGDYRLVDRANFVEPGAETPVRVVFVPKTHKTPRVIAIEPTCMQYTQQSLMESFVKRLESKFVDNDWFADRINVVHGMIGFTDQEPNRLLAREGSLSGDLATLDLSEASDRVSNLHVIELLRRHPSLSGAVQACRSTKADVFGEVIDLAKFASMGSALCFPMEAMVFLGIIFLGIQDAQSTRLTRRQILSFSGKVRVFGDDIIVPKEYVHHVVQRLESFGFKVNAGKSFWNGKFRESCGKEFFAGEDVSISRVRMEFPSPHDDVSERHEKIIKLVSLRNQFYMTGLWGTARYLEGEIRRVIKHYPTVAPTSPVLGRWSVCGFNYEIHKYHTDTHAPLVKGYVQNSRPPKSNISGRGALLKSFLKRGEQPFADVKHLERQGRPQSVNIKLRFAQPF